MSYMELQANIDSRFNQLRNSHLEGLDVFQALQSVELVGIDESMTGVDPITDAISHADEGFANHLSSVQTLKGQVIPDGFAAAEIPIVPASDELHSRSDQWAQGAVQVQEHVQQAIAEDQRLRDADVTVYDEFRAGVEQFEQGFKTSLDALAQQLEAFRGDTQDTRQPAYLDVLQSFNDTLREIGDARIPDADSAFRGSFDASQDNFMQVAESVGNAYLQFAQSTLIDLERFTSDQFSNVWQREVERLQGAVLQRASDEITDSITETELSVAISGALTPIMPELIAFNKAVSALEDAIQIFKDAKRLFGG